MSSVSHKEDVDKSSYSSPVGELFPALRDEGPSDTHIMRHADTEGGAVGPKLKVAAIGTYATKGCVRPSRAGNHYSGKPHGGCRTFYSSSCAEKWKRSAGAAPKSEPQGTPGAAPRGRYGGEGRRSLEGGWAWIEGEGCGAGGRSGGVWREPRTPIRGRSRRTIVGLAVQIWMT